MGVLRSIRTTVMIANYLLGNYKEVIWVIGSGRSGTSWIADLINYHKRYRRMFEPFHPWLVKDIDCLVPHQYIRPTDSGETLEQKAREVFSGKFTHPRVDSGNRSPLYHGLIIKDVFANLFACWASLRFPHLKIVLVLRHPFSVALSKYKTRDWLWMTEPTDFLNQKSLWEDYLHPFEDLIRKTSARKDYILNQILIWCVVNYVPLRQFRAGEIYIVFYEEMLLKTDGELSKIYDYLIPGGEKHHIVPDEKLISTPNFVSNKKGPFLKDRLSLQGWKEELTPEQKSEGLAILQSFGFDQLYDQNSLPDRQVLSTIGKSIME